jgi:hypothetical protein
MAKLMKLGLFLLSLVLLAACTVAPALFVCPHIFLAFEPTR